MADQLRDCDVVLTSRVRLARNHADLPFPGVMGEEAAKESVARAVQATREQGLRLLRMAELSPIQQQVLVERHLISLDLLRKADVSAALLRDDETVSIMLNEEDHLRLQALYRGFALKEAAQAAFAIDDVLGEKLLYAFDTDWGYLTSCPTNTGTGMRASTMLHLPALTWAGEMGKVSQAIAKLGLTIRGLYGEGSDAQGDLYQLSNQITLGRTEQEILDAINAVTAQMAGWERKARAALRAGDRIALEDRLMRALGVMERARRMTAKEFMQRWSCVRLAACMGLCSHPVEMLDRMLVTVQPASLQQAAGEELKGDQRDQRRAVLIQSMLSA